MTRNRPAAAILFWVAVALILVALPPRLYAPDGGVGRRTGGIAEIDPRSAVAGSRIVRSIASMEAERGRIEIHAVTVKQDCREPDGTLLGRGGTNRNGAYRVRLREPLTPGTIIQAFNVTRGYCSSGVAVTPEGAPEILQPVRPGTRVVRGWATPGHRVQIVNTASGFGIALSPPADERGFFRVRLNAPLTFFQNIRARDVDANPILSSESVPVIDTPLRSNDPFELTGITDRPFRAVAPGFEATRFRTRIPQPLGIAAGNGLVFVVTGTVPGELVRVSGSGLFAFDPLQKTLDLISPLNGVGLVFHPAFGPFGSEELLFVSRPRIFRVDRKVLADRGDGEIFQIDPPGQQFSRGTVPDLQITVFERLIQHAPLDMVLDTTGDFGGGLLFSTLGSGKVVASDGNSSTTASLGNTPGVVGVAISPGTFGTLARRIFVAQPGLRQISYLENGDLTPFVTGLISPTGLSFGTSGRFDGFLYVTDPGAGAILQIDPNGEVTPIAARLRAPYGITFSEAAQALFVTDYRTGDIIMIQ